MFEHTENNQIAANKIKEESSEKSQLMHVAIKKVKMNSFNVKQINEYDYVFYRNAMVFHSQH
jgi:hypothetical protein